ncbi:MAG: hypothetical protein HZA08_09785 [Nitrospirae bacterium]|nr:hypothetical protein [Nitrospirota bacterium]
MRILIQIKSGKRAEIISYIFGEIFKISKVFLKAVEKGVKNECPSSGYIFR